MADPEQALNVPLKDPPKKTWQAWLKGLGVAVVGGAINALVIAIVDPHMLNEMLYTGDTALLKAAIATGVFKGLLYMKGSPLPE